MTTSTKSFIRLLTVGLLAASLPQLAAAQDVLVSQNFDGSWSTTSPPSGWRIGFDGDTSANDWHRAPDLGPDPWTDNSTPYALLNNDPPEGGEDSLVSPAFDGQPYSRVVVRCSTYWGGGFIGSWRAQLLGSVNGGPFEQTVHNYTPAPLGPELQEFELPWAVGSANCRLAWVFSGNGAEINYWCVDNVAIIGYTSGGDVGVLRIIRPAGVVDSGSIMRPQAVVKNYGASAESFWAGIRIGDNYADTAQVTNLGAGDTFVLEFGDWLPAPRGPVAVSCSTRLGNDINRSNDRTDTTATVRVVDAGILNIFAPRDTVDSGTVVTPQALVKNYGTETLGSLNCIFRIDPWADTVTVNDLAPGGEQVVVFRNWAANTRGSKEAVCTALLPGDMNPRNDATVQRFYVKGTAAYVDAEALAVVAPRGSVRAGSLVTPSGVVVNNGTSPTTGYVYFYLFQGLTPDTVYRDSTTRMLQPGLVDTVASFDAWEAQPEGAVLTAQLRVTVPDDMDPVNDVASAEVEVVGDIHDVRPVEILEPGALIQPGPVAPKARVRNDGTFTETFDVAFTILRGTEVVYDDLASVANLAVGASREVTFRSWEAMPGIHVASCSTLLGGDANPENDRLRKDFRVEELAGEPGWHELTPLPLAPSGKVVKRGGALALLGSGLGASIYATKGNKTLDFYRFSILDTSWSILDPLPLGPSGKEIDKGGTLISDGERFIYCVKGRKTLEFWRYDTDGDSGWLQLADIPEGPKGKEVKGGACLQHVVIGDTSYLYLLKGYYDEFYRFNVATGTWQTRASAPAGSSGKTKYKDGSFIVYDGESTLYCCKAKYNETHQYDIPSDQWTAELAPMPLVGQLGRRKKIKDGGSGCWYRGRMYCLKGGNTQEFWRFDPTENAWLELDTMPLYGSTGKKKKVKYGADIVSLGNAAFYALKGNKTVEFWYYGLTGGTGVRTGQSPVPVPSERLALRPNPASVRTAVRLPAAGPAIIRVFDAAGQLVLRGSAASGPTTLDVSELVPGVYLVRVEQAGREETGKLIVK